MSRHVPLWGWRHLYGIQGRLDAQSYRWHSGSLIVQAVLLSMALAVVMVLVPALLGFVIPFLGSLSSLLLVVTMMLWGIVLFVLQFGIIIRRLHDFGYSGWWLLLIFPLLGIADTLLMTHLSRTFGLPLMSGLVSGLFGLLLLIFPGDATENEFGPPVAEGEFTSTATVNFFGWVVVGIIVLGLVLAPFFPYNPEEQKRAEEEMRQKIEQMFQRRQSDMYVP
jgi:uncharacterized membrane protein YhaH (DUF805 family)